MYEITSEQFDGPYDLLLQLIERKDLEITEVNLSHVTDQFLLYLDSLEDVNSEELADFLVVATKLLYLKSKALLPKVEVEIDGDMLENHLKMYKRFVEASEHIQDFFESDFYAFSKEKIPTPIDISFAPGESLSCNQLYEAIQTIVKRLEPVVHLPRAIIEKTVSLKERVIQLRSLFAHQKELSFHSILEQSESKSDIIVSFLALLDLINTKEIHFSQQNNFSEINLVHKSTTAI